MGEAKRKKQAMENKPYWAFFTADDHAKIGLILDEALNYLGYYTREQAKQAILNGMMIWDIADMNIDDENYTKIKSLCLRQGYFDPDDLLDHSNDDDEYVSYTSYIKWCPHLVSDGDLFPFLFSILGLKTND